MRQYILLELDLLVFYLLRIQGERIEQQQVTGGEERGVQEERDSPEIFYILNLVFYLFSGVWTSMVPLFEQGEGVNSLLCNVLKLTLFRFLSRLCRK